MPVRNKILNYFSFLLHITKNNHNSTCYDAKKREHTNKCEIWKKKIENSTLNVKLHLLILCVSLSLILMKPTMDLPSTLSYTSENDTIIKQNVTEDMELVLLEGALSSTLVLIVVLTIIFTLVLTSLLTYCFHKWKLKVKKLERAQEEYQRDQEKVESPCTSWLQGQLQL